MEKQNKENIEMQTIMSPWGNWDVASHADFLKSLSRSQGELKEHTEGELMKRNLSDKRICFKRESVTYLINPDNGISFDLSMDGYQKQKNESGVWSRYSSPRRFGVRFDAQYGQEYDRVLDLISKEIIVNKMLGDPHRNNDLCVYYLLHEDLERDKKGILEVIEGLSGCVELLKDPELIRWAGKIASLDRKMEAREMRLDDQREAREESVDKMREKYVGGGK